MGSTYFIAVCIILVSILAWQRYQKIKRRPKYKVLEKKGSIEIRQYEPYIIAQIDVHGNRKESIKFGFVQLA
ncbi:MAG: hypothetical protein FJZ56_03785, partial [Chlamydiae bacterium]|nr:hypothetical protein [Chlamydiota bacterium]